MGTSLTAKMTASFHPPDPRKLLWVLLPLFAFLYYGGMGVLGLGFETDDWYLVGPGVAADFLRDPLGIFSGRYVYSHHYQPLIILFYGVVSVLFRGHAFLYHLLNLLLLAGGLILYDLLLRRLGIPWAARVAGAVFFGFFWLQLNVIHWAATASYLVLTILLFQILLLWDRYLREGRARDLLMAGLLVVLGAWIHSQALTFPLLLLAWCLLLPGGGERRWKTVGPFLVSLLLLLVLVQVLPLHFLSQGKVLAKLDTNPAMILGRVTSAVVEGVWPSLAGPVAGGKHGEGLPLPGPRSLPVPVLLGLAAAFWAIRRTQWRLLVLGLALASLTLVLSAVSDRTLIVHFQRIDRFYWFPVLGLSFSVAALLSPLGRVEGKRVKAIVLAALAFFLAVFLLNNHDLTRYYWRSITAQHRFLASSIARFRENLARILEATEETGGETGGCKNITILDVPLMTSRPPDIRNGGALYSATHANIYRFYRLGREGVEVIFLPFPFESGKAIPPGDCVFLAINGDLIRGPGSR